MSTRELSVPYMAITYTWSFPCFSWFLFPVKTEGLIPEENSRIYSAPFERLQHYKCFFSAFLCYLLITDHWQFVSQSLFTQLLFSCPLPRDSEVHCKMSVDGLCRSSKDAPSFSSLQITQSFIFKDLGFGFHLLHSPVVPGTSVVTSAPGLTVLLLPFSLVDLFLPFQKDYVTN